MDVINDLIEGNTYPIVPISAKNNINLDNLYSEISNKINVLLKKDLKKLSVSMEKYDKILIWIKE